MYEYMKIYNHMTLVYHLENTAKEIQVAIITWLTHPILWGVLLSC